MSGTKTYYLYDQGEPVVELNAAGAVQATNVLAPDGLVARQQSGTWTQYTFDQQGNVAQRLNASQSITSSSTYDAYGVESSSGTPSDVFGYNARWGYLLDRETGLYLCQHRYYDPGTGRWVNRDPWNYSGGKNLYSYGSDGPTISIDLTGQNPVPILLVVGACCAAAALAAALGRISPEQACEICTDALVAGTVTYIAITFWPVIVIGIITKPGSGGAGPGSLLPFIGDQLGKKPWCHPTNDDLGDDSPCNSGKNGNPSPVPSGGSPDPSGGFPHRGGIGGPVWS